MSQTNQNLMEIISTKNQLEKKKRKFEELEPYSDDDDSLIDEENNLKGSKDRVNSKKSKNKNTHNNLLSLRELRLMKKITNKENQGPILSQDQIEFAKKIVEENSSKEPSEGLTSKLKSEVVKNKEKEKLIINENVLVKNISNNIKPEKSSYLCIESSPNLNFTLLNNKNSSEEILHYVSLLNSCSFKIVQNNMNFISLEVEMEKNEKERMKFLINFNKKSEEKDYIEYIPVLTTFKFEGEDIIFYEELDIHKEDLGKMIRRLLNYKYK